MTWNVSSVSLDLSVLSFLFFVVLTVLSLKKVKPQAQPGTDMKLQAGLGDITKLVEALAKLTDSLTKAGPAIASLVASIIFMLLAFATPPH